ncbi:ADP-ribosyl cyclase/cyclic ADP-ribose hydrolase 1 isoform 1 [Schistosoma japonicum]|uniref:ADP-ribosyl cyclase/cyclic ADP-ribose hydrolase 1 isoform 1 n=1 Tax=Schistosoma japonicum TaxID=6182 RepID=A0A4Z2DEH7_SCHJA|nr:ADP-ribosyl cyclase/cyclic ADP-ribose hydrolase 1 isoform 1 [Schistosoma japonicum]
MNIMLSFILLNIIITAAVQCQRNFFADIVISRCILWTVTHNITNVNCVDVWSSFEKILLSISNQSECIVKSHLFDNFVHKTFEMQQQPNQSGQYFHSQVTNVIRGMCKRLGVCRSLETTFPGYLFDELDWCNNSLIDSSHYGTVCKCDYYNGVINAFWKSASAEYARRASGTIFVVLNGSAKLPFNENRHTCESINLLRLSSKVKSSNISFSCINDPLEFKHYQCIQNPFNKQCRFASSANSNRFKTLLLLSSLFICSITNSFCRLN